MLGEEVWMPAQAPRPAWAGLQELLHMVET